MASKKAKKKAAPKSMAQRKSQTKSAPKAKSKGKIKIKAKTPAKAAVKTVAKTTAAKTTVAKKTSVASVALTPSRDGVLVERLAEPDRTPGGLYIPVTALEKPLKGRVISAGKGKFNKKGKFRPLDVQAGDEVLFSKFSGTEVNVDGKEYLLIREDEILGVVS